MAKELGQIHTLNDTLSIAASGDILDIDLPGQLTNQLQRMVRQGNFFKIVGIDASLDLQGAATGGQVTGWIRYYSPTKGRCDAYRGAFKAMKEQMKTQGINTMTNPLYDFKCQFNDQSPAGFPNLATLDGTNGLILHSTATPGASVFGIHNDSVTPVQTGSAGTAFSEGFDTLLQSGAKTDFVLNDAIPFSGNTNLAATGWEYIPFSISWEPGAQSAPVVMNWRPDPALYLAVMCGLLQVYIEEAAIVPPGNPINMNIAVMVSGWKSIMSERRRRKNSSKKEKSTKTTSKK